MSGTDVSRRELLRALGVASAAGTLGSSAASAAAGSGRRATGTARATAGEPVALQYFHEDWQTITADLDRVTERGFDAVWLQQPAKNKLDWSDQDGRNDPPLGYQPIDLRTFDSALGTEAELATLIDRAHEEGLDVYLDTVMNHMAAGREPKYDFPQFGYADFHHDPDPTEETWELYGLPDLKQESAYVRGELKEYMRKMVEIGADGYRFDAAKHIPERFFWEYANQWAADWDMFRVGEVLDGSVDYVQTYVDQGPGMHAFDYPLYFVAKEVFSGGDMRRLEGAGLVAQDPFHAMPFVENHDVEAPSQYKLAHAFVLTIEGYPVLYNLYPDWLLGDEDIATMIEVKTTFAGGETRWRYTDRDLAVYERAEHLLVGLNNGSSERTVQVETSWPGATLTDHAGTGPDVTTDSSGAVELTVPAGGWVFYAPVADDPSPPTAAFDYEPATPLPGEAVTFDASASSDPDGDVASYGWDVDGDSDSEATGETATHAFPEPGQYEVALTVADGSEETADDTRTATVDVVGVVDQYDRTGDGCIDLDELNAGIADFVGGRLTRDQLGTLLDAYFDCL